MSDFVVSGRITADSTDAERALKGTGDAMRQAGTETSKLGQEGRKAATQTDTLTRAERQASQAANALAASNSKAALTARQVGAANGVAAGSLSNLTAQFNDIGVMLAAGQNPLQLALQQGTQISQVIGPMGAAGAVKSLGAAFLGMLNPVSLVTIGTIAGGAALFQWAQGALAAGEDSRDLEEIIEDLTDAMSNLDGSSTRSKTSIGDLRQEYGRYTDQARELLDIERGIAAVIAQSSMAAASRNVAGAFGDIAKTTASDVAIMSAALTKLEDEYDDALNLIYNPGRVDAGANPVIAQMADHMGISAEQAIVKLADYRNQLVGLIDDWDVGSDAGIAMADAIARMGTASGIVEQADAANDLAVQIYNATDGLADADEEMLSLYQNLLDVVRSGLEFAALDLDQGVISAAAAARDLADELSVSYATAFQIQQLRANGGTGATGPDAAISQLRQDGRIGGAVVGVVDTFEFGPDSRPKRRERTGSKRDERDPTVDLITSLEQELAILRELDPVQQEMLRQREALNGASAAQREQIEGLITTRLREADAMELAEANMQALRDVSYSMFDDLIDSGGDLESVLNNLSNAIFKMVQQALLLGEGPLAGLLSPGGGGGLIGSVINAVLPGRGGIPGRADGGMIPGYADGGDLQVGGRAAGALSGVGGPREDNILFWGSDGEYMVNARSTAKYRHILEAINQDRMPAFANGGRLGGTNSSPAMLTPFDGGMTAQRGDDGSVQRIELVLHMPEGVTVEQVGEIATGVALTIQQKTARVQEKAMPGQLSSSQMRRG